MDAQEFSKEYIEIISDVLNCHQPNPDKDDLHWDNTVGHELQNKLKRHFRLNGKDAIQSIQYNHRDDNIYFHFGYSEDPYNTIKYAPLYTDKVVMQDLLYRNLSASDYNKEGIKEIAAEILSWRDLVYFDDGYVYIVPSPYFWSNEFRNQSRRIDNHLNLICTPPLYAARELDAIPFTDNEKCSNRFLEIEECTAFFKEAANHLAQGGSRDYIKDDLMDKIEEHRKLNAMPYLLGSEKAEFWYREDYEARDIIELSNKFSGFRKDIGDIINKIDNEDNINDIEYILNSHSKQIQDDYRIIKEEHAEHKSDLRKALRKKFLNTIGTTVPVMVGVNFASLIQGVDLHTALTLGAGGAGTYVAISELIDAIEANEQEEFNPRYEDLYEVFRDLEDKDEQSTSLQTFVL